MVQIHHLSFSYLEKEKPLILIPQLKIANREKVFLFGPSGSGKTTFLEILSGILKPLSGQIFIDDREMTKMTDSQRDHFRGECMGFIFQNFNLVPSLSVLENVLLPNMWAPKKSQVVEEEAVQILKLLGLNEKLSSSVFHLSMGQQQRVAAARAFLRKPKLLLADEPTSGLDYDSREDFLEVLFELCKTSETTLLFVSHDRSLAHLFDRQMQWEEINKGYKI